MSGVDPTVKKETLYIAVWVIALSLVMEAVFLIIGKWDPGVLLGNLGGAVLATGSYFLLGLTVSKALSSGKPEDAARRVRASAMLRLLGAGAGCALLVGVAKTNVYATLIPLLFPRIALAFRPAIDRKRGAAVPEGEGSDLIE